MKIELIGENRFGITQEVLATLAQQQLDLAAVEVVTEHIYLDIPALTQDNLTEVLYALKKIKGIKHIKCIDLLPNEQRRLHLDALLSTLPDPVFAVDAVGIILSANTAATTPLNLNETDLIGRNIKQILSAPDLSMNIDSRLEYPKEVTLADQPYLLEQKTIRSPSASPNHPDHQGNGKVAAGSMLILHSANRLGHHISKVQMGRVEGFDGITGQSQTLHRIKERAQRFASINAPLLIQGETGTGKELFARAVHQASPWHASAFLALNCATLPENLVESELFGYSPGAFSGANRSGKPGLLELANGGTAFLDEIGEMSTYVQAKLLRFIQDGTFRRVGGKDERKINVRIICATHRDLEQLVHEGLFREDLMYRLNVLNLQLPALRAHPEDIPQLAKLFITRAANQIGCISPKLSQAANDVLKAHYWPGNVRQLENLLFRTVALSQDKTISPNELHLAGIDTDKKSNHLEPENWKTAHANFEKELLTRFYKRYPSTRKLAKRLEVSHTTIAEKLRTYNIVNKNT